MLPVDNEPNSSESHAVNQHPPTQHPNTTPRRAQQVKAAACSTTQGELATHPSHPTDRSSPTPTPTDPKCSPQSLIARAGEPQQIET